MNREILDGFCSYLSRSWEDEFMHSYNISNHHSWGHWRKVIWPNCTSNLNPNSPDKWYCNSIKEAAERYSWTGNDAARDFENLSSTLNNAVRNNDEDAVARICLEIFKWGGVGKNSNDRSVLWLEKQRRHRELCDGLLEACSLLQDMRSDLSRFDGDCLLMNSAMTKVYAALKPSKLIIYDGRVGAALGLLARHYLHSIKYDGALPEELQFPWGKARGVQVRDPSDERFKFPQLFGQRKDMLHAEWMRRTSDLLRKVAITVSPSSSCSLASLERALFMIGYDVSGSA